MPDQETIAAYDAKVDDYAKLTAKQKTDPALLDFIKLIKPGGLVLDLGCGPAYSSATMREHGLRVDPVDASAEMVRLANETYDIRARQALFSDIEEIDFYDGVWANFSLLHAKPEELPSHLSAIYHALKIGGVFHVALKSGSGVKRDRLGRLYAYYSEQELGDLLVAAGFTLGKVKSGELKGLTGDLEPWISITSHRA